MMRSCRFLLKELTFKIPESLEVVRGGAPKHIRYEVHNAGIAEFTGPRDHVETSKDELHGALYQMIRIRRMETVANQQYKQRKIRGFCHLYIGQEACLVGMESVLTYEDSIVTSYRDHAVHLTRGGTVCEVMAEQYGRLAGASKGKGGSMHMYKVKNNYYGGHGIVGAQVPIGAGLALKYWYKNPEKPGNVAVTIYGDGAANQGQVFEAFNMAALWRLPVLFVCENNHFGMGTSEGRASASVDFYRRCEYIPGLKVDGMDFLAVKEATRYAKEWAANGNGPVVLELDSYRYMGHSMSDPGTSYRTRDDVEKVRAARDPIEKLKTLMTDNQLITPEEIKNLEKRAKKEVEEGVAQAEASPETPIEQEIWTDVYMNDELPIRSCDLKEKVWNVKS